MAVEPAQPFLDDSRPLAGDVEFALLQPPSKIEAAAIVLDSEHPAPNTRAETDDDVMRAAVFAHVHQGLLENANQFARGALRHSRFIEVRYETRLNACVALEA